MTIRKQELRFALVTLIAIAGGCTSSRKTGAPVTTTTASSKPPAASTSTTKPKDTGCVNGIVNDAIRAALVQANGLPGGEVVAGATYYGTCGSVSYAVTRFHAAPNATLQEQVSFQDDGSGPRFFVRQDGGTWTLAGSVPYDQTASCATFTQLPSALKTLWQNCPLG